jgi:two-component system sensor histidine kinase KdpD
VTAEERKRGRLKIYLGMAAGAGKTYAMLSDALVEKNRGVDVVAGYIEPHGRIETEQFATQLEQIPFLNLKHKEILIREFDLDAALKRRPQVLLVDELAHTNTLGLRHTKRWQDIEECLVHGINVFTTLNVQHIESLTDVVTKITGIAVSETVPDAVVKNADEIELIDITPEELVQRLKDGKVYIPDKVGTALANFFKPGNLLALRELVLRLTAERVDDQLITFRRLHNVREVWPAKPRVLVCISPNYLAERIIRTARRLSSALHTDLVALSVENVSRPGQFEHKEKLIQNGLDLAEDLGAQIVRSSADDIVSEILKVASDKNANIIVVGKPVRSRIREYFFGSVVDELVRQSGDLDIYVITDKVGKSRVPLLPQVGPPTWAGVFSALALTTGTTLFCFLAHPYLEPSNLIMFYLLAVAWAGSKLGRLESVVTSILSVLAFDFFFVPPFWTFAVSDIQYFVTFGVMLIIALLISTLTMQLHAQAQLVNRRERRTAALYDVSKRLASAVSASQIAAIVKDKSMDLFGCDGALFIPNEESQLKTPLLSESKFEQETSEAAVAHWVSEHKTPAGRGTDTLAGAKARYVPLSTKASMNAVLGVYCSQSQWQPAFEPLLDAFVTQVGSALERVLADQEATNVQLEVERERVRNILLRSISHDFRSPLAAITGAADTLDTRYVPESHHGKELVKSIKKEASRLSRLVRNVLDLTRLEGGKIVLKKEWESFEELIGAALERTTSLLESREIVVEIAPTLPLVQVDASAMEQVFINLLENIAKHTPAIARVFISARVDGSYLLIEISDTGPGLPTGKETQIFEKAFRGSDEDHGFGLGLTICQTIVHAHGGRIVASNLPAGGARFTITLPLPEQQPEVRYGG